jgi:hypothetical protein
MLTCRKKRIGLEHVNSLVHRVVEKSDFARMQVCACACVLCLCIHALHVGVGGCFVFVHA